MPARSPAQRRAMALGAGLTRDEFDAIFHDERRARRLQLGSPAYHEQLEQAIENTLPAIRERERRAAGSFGSMNNERHSHDLYETQPEAVMMLADHHPLVLTEGVYDPSCGRGAILETLVILREQFNGSSYGSLRELWGSDIYDWAQSNAPRAVQAERRWTFLGMQDFMNVTGVPSTCQHIVMNPPYKDSEKHVRHALRLVEPFGTVCALLRWNWIAAKRRADLIPHIDKAIICGRLKMLPPDVEDQGHSGTVDFAWFILSARTGRQNMGMKVVRA